MPSFFPGPRLLSQFQSVTVLGRYQFILLGKQRRMCVTELLIESVRDNGTVGDWTGDVQKNPTAYLLRSRATVPLGTRKIKISYYVSRFTSLSQVINCLVMSRNNRTASVVTAASSLITFRPKMESIFDTSIIIIRLEARLRPNVGFTLRGNLAVFTRSAITPPQINRFGWNLEHS